MKKVFDQTVRDIKREVNKKVLKVPGIEQKVLDATSNEPWGPHGTLLADIAQATRNYHEYQMIMSVIWKRINDTGKNWRHVYKALTVLDYLVANGSERVIDEIRERAYQISTLSDFQYIDSSGRDQGSNVRRKSQSLVVLVNDKERIIEVRQKAAANRDKFRNASSGGMYRPGSYSSTGGYGDRYDDERYEGRYGSKDEDRNGNGYGRDREYNYRDDDRYGRDYEDRYSRDGSRDDDYRGRSRSVDGYGSRGRSSDMDRDRAFDDDGHSSSRGGGARADDQAQDGSNGKQLERKFSEQNLGAPPNYEEAVSESRSPAYSERNGETLAATAPGSSSPTVPTASSPPAPKAASPTASSNMSPPASQEIEVADEFDPRGPMLASPTSAPATSVAPTTSNNAEMDLLGSLSDVFSPNPLAIMPVTSATTSSEANAQINFPGPSFAAAQPVTNVMSQPFEDPFGDSPFKAFPSADAIPAQQQSSASTASFQPAMNQTAEPPHGVMPNADPVNDFGFGDSFSAATYSAPNAQPPLSNSQFLPQELSTAHPETDILADILPPTGPPAANLPAGYSVPTGQQPVHLGASTYGNFNPQMGSVAMPLNMGPHAPQFSTGNFFPQGVSAVPIPSNIVPQTPAASVTQFNDGNLYPQLGSTTPVVSQIPHHSATGPAPPLNNGNFLPQQGSAAPTFSQDSYQTPSGPPVQHNNDVLGNLFSQGSNVSLASQSSLPSSTGSLAIVPQPSKDKFETKSTVWADTLSRGLVNLNISGPKINPLADIGIDFDAINRKDKRMEKPTTTTVTSTVTMGKAMGSGSGIGRAGASVLRPPSSPMMGSSMGMGMGMGGAPPGSGMGMGGYGVMNQGMGMGMGGMGMGMNMGMMNMGMGRGGPMQTPTGLPPGSAMPGGYNPMMSSGGYPHQHPYGGYR